MRLSTTGSLALAGALCVLSTALRFVAFQQTPFATGWDSYFYLVQLRALDSAGQMHSPDASLIYPYLRVWCWLLSDYVAGMKIGVAALCGTLTLLAWPLPHPNIARPPLAWTLMAWTVFSPQLTYFAAQYPKNLLGFILLCAFIRALPTLRLAQPSTWFLPLFLLVVNYFGHRLTFGLAVVWTGLWLLEQRSRATLGWLLGLAGVALALLFLGSQIFPGLAQAADWGRLSGGLTTTPQFAPVSFFKKFGWERIGAAWAAEILVVLLLFAYQVGRVSPRRWAVLGIGILMLFPFLTWSLTGLAWRMFLVFGLLMPFLFRVKAPVWVSRKTEIGIITGLLLLASWSWRTYQPARHDPDYAFFAQIKNGIARHWATQPRPELIIAHNALAEYLTFETGTDAMPWLPEYRVDSTRLWRIAAGISSPQLQYWASGDSGRQIVYLGQQYHFLPEHTWKRALARANTEPDSAFLAVAHSWLNPHRVRPGWLLRRKK